MRIVLGLTAVLFFAGACDWLNRSDLRADASGTWLATIPSTRGVLPGAFLRLHLRHDHGFEMQYQPMQRLPFETLTATGTWSSTEVPGVFRLHFADHPKFLILGERPLRVVYLGKAGLALMSVNSRPTLPVRRDVLLLERER